ncbi:MAG TPA: hypothetical protein VFW28_09700 [Micropepsaceae bacterium]|nr:hypothetical protein [Micropepsaceae bacterium]
MTSGVPRLNALQLDALSELVNLGVSRAAASLHEMIGHQVVLSVPNVGLVSHKQAVSMVENRDVRQFIAVRESFEGPIAGRALLIFPNANGIELVRALTGGHLTLDEIIEFEQEALAETGNIILNGCLATIANMLWCSLRTSIPEVLHGSGETLFNAGITEGTDDLVLLLYITFAVHERDITGYIALLMDTSSVISLVKLLNQFIERSAGAGELQPHA